MKARFAGKQNLSGIGMRHPRNDVISFFTPSGAKSIQKSRIRGPEVFKCSHRCLSESLN